MRAIHVTGFSLINNSKFWLLLITSGLITIHLNLTWRSENIDLLSTSLLFWAAVVSLLWQKHETLKLESNLLSSCIGGSLIIWLLLKSAFFISGYDPFLRLSPLISALGISLLASGIKGLKQYWQELTILCFIVIPPSLLSLLIDLPPLTAKFTTYILWQFGFNVSRQGVNIVLPTGAVEVYPGCSGVNVMLQLLGLALLFLVMFPTDLAKKVITPIVAVLLAFVVNGFRVALMAVLAHSNKAAFEYWHEGDGSLLFSMLAVILFGLFCYFLLLQGEVENQDFEEV